MTAVVDYAHNKLSFEKLFGSTREEYPDHDIVAIFGCPGYKAYIRRKDLGPLPENIPRRFISWLRIPARSPADFRGHCPVCGSEELSDNEIIEDRGVAIQ